MVTLYHKKHPLHHALKEYEAADKALQTMTRINQEFSEYESAWREVLRRLERVWTKMQAAVHGKRCWQRIESEVNHLRKTDPLLVYLIHARNADEHSIQDLAKEHDWNLSATPKDNGILLTWSPWDRPLLPVRNRGVTYCPPRMHLSKSIEQLLGKGKTESHVIAELAMEFYASVLNRVSMEVIGNDYDA